MVINNSKSKSSNKPTQNWNIPEGFVAGGISAGIKDSGKHDLGMILCERPVVAAAMLTTNRFQAAPIVLCHRRLSRYGRDIRGVVVNSGNANAMTGEEGARDAFSMVKAAEEAAQCPPGSFLVASTGIIGRKMPIDTILKGMPDLKKSLSAKGWEDFARAIMTTDLAMKVYSRTIEAPDGTRGSILGIAKGSGMIRPDMATMLAFVVTDFPLPSGKARPLLRQAVDSSFNTITVDGQTSTNDMVLLMSSSVVTRKQPFSDESEAAFGEGLTGVCQDLAKAIVRDGEGATKLITIEVTGTHNASQAQKLGMEVANSMLVKTALHGADPNWGRIIQALGQCGVPFATGVVGVKMQGETVLTAGEPVKFDRAKLVKEMTKNEILIEIQVGNGPGKASVWTCDLTKDYIDINTAYN